MAQLTRATSSKVYTTTMRTHVLQIKANLTTAAYKAKDLEKGQNENPGMAGVETLSPTTPNIPTNLH